MQQLLNNVQAPVLYMPDLGCVHS